MAKEVNSPEKKRTGSETVEAGATAKRAKMGGTTGEGTDTAVLEQKTKLPLELIGRVFDFYYDLMHDDWYETNKQKGLLTPLLLCRGLLPLGKQALWAHPHFDWEALSILRRDEERDDAFVYLQEELREVRHLTLRPAMPPYYDDDGPRDEETAADYRLPELLALTPNLYSLTLLEFPVYKGFDAVLLLECLRLAGNVKKLRLDLQMMNLDVDWVGHLIHAAEHSSRPDKTIVGSLRDPADMDIQPTGVENQSTTFHPLFDDLKLWWKRILNEETYKGNPVYMELRALLQRPRYVTDGAYPLSVPEQPVTKGNTPFLPPDFEAPASVQREDGNYDVDLITKTEYLAMATLAYSPSVDKRQVAARWLRDRPQFEVTSRHVNPDDPDFSGLPLNFLDSQKQLVNRLRWRLVDHFKAHTPQAVYFGFRDPTAACVPCEKLCRFWTQLPIPHIRVRVGRGLDPEDVFGCEKSYERPTTTERVRDIVLPKPCNAGGAMTSNASGRSLVTLWKKTTVTYKRSYPVHPLTRRFELVSNTAREYDGLGDMKKSFGLLLGEQDEDWRGIEPGTDPRPMPTEERERIIAAYKADYAKHFGGDDVYVEYTADNIRNEGAEEEAENGSSDEEDELLGTPPGASDDESEFNDDVPGGGAGPLPALAPAAQPLLLPVQQFMQQQVQQLLQQFMEHMEHEQAQAAAQHASNAHAHAQFLARAHQLDQQLAQLQASGELTPQQLAANQQVQEQLTQAITLIFQNPGGGPPGHAPLSETADSTTEQSPMQEDEQEEEPPAETQAPGEEETQEDATEGS